MAIKETNVTIMVKDMDSSVSFYQSLGFEMKNRWENHYAQLSAPGILIGLHPADEAMYAGSGNISIGFTSDDFENEKELLHKLSIGFEERNEKGGEFIHFNDPDGTALYFIKPKW